MIREQFERTFKKLSPRRREVLEKFLAGKSDTEIAQALHIERATVRQHISGICTEFGLINDFPDARRSQRPNLLALFAKYKPELVAPEKEKETVDKIADLSFVGREGAIADLDDLINKGAKVVLIYAGGGVGKTTLARRYLQQRFSRFIEFPIAKETQNITSVESLLEEKLKQLGEEPGREFGVSLERLKQKLKQEKIGLLIDNFEPALDEKGKLVTPHRRYVELLRILTTPQLKSLTLITSRDRIRESALNFSGYHLSGLDFAAWQEFFVRRFDRVSVGEEFDLISLEAIHKYYGGNAKAMEILSSAIQQDYDSDIKAYWQANQKYLPSEGELEDLVSCQFQRLAKQNIAAYNLLCRLGCYRYQDVATVPLEGIFCLLWDVAERERLKVVNVLRDRSLIEFFKGEYWLHPVIRAEAVARLKSSEDWEKANRDAAQFWTESVETVEDEKDAFQAFEAYHHYLEVDDVDAASSVINNFRANPWDEDESLGMSFYRLGLLQIMILAIERLVSKINNLAVTTRILGILGDLYWIKGNLGKSIKSHKLSGDVARKIKNKEQEAFATYNQGLCYLDYFELDRAVDYFERTILLVKEYKNIKNFLHLTLYSV